MEKSKKMTFYLFLLTSLLASAVINCSPIALPCQLVFCKLRESRNADDVFIFLSPLDLNKTEITRRFGRA
jgi:hypothetical protein